MIPTIGHYHIQNLSSTDPGQDKQKSEEQPLQDEAQRAAADGVLTQLRPDEAEPLPTETPNQDLNPKFDRAVEPEPPKPCEPTAAAVQPGSSNQLVAAATPVEETASSSLAASTPVDDKAKALIPSESTKVGKDLVVEIQDGYHWQTWAQNNISQRCWKLGDTACSKLSKACIFHTLFLRLCWGAKDIQKHDVSNQSVIFHGSSLPGLAGWSSTDRLIQEGWWWG